MFCNGIHFIHFNLRVHNGYIFFSYYLLQLLFLLAFNYATNYVEEKVCLLVSENVAALLWKLSEEEGKNGLELSLKFKKKGILGILKTI